MKSSTFELKKMMYFVYVIWHFRDWSLFMAGVVAEEKMVG